MISLRGDILIWSSQFCLGAQTLHPLDVSTLQFVSLKKAGLKGGGRELKQLVSGQQNTGLHGFKVNKDDAELLNHTKLLYKSTGIKIWNWRLI